MHAQLHAPRIILNDTYTLPVDKCHPIPILDSLTLCKSWKQYNFKKM